jgi:hypothetical protein
LVDAGKIQREGLGNKERRLFQQGGKFHAGQRRLPQRSHSRLLVCAIQQGHLEGRQRLFLFGAAIGRLRRSIDWPGHSEWARRNLPPSWLNQ